VSDDLPFLAHRSLDSAFKTDIKSNTVVAGPEQLKNALPLT
jgi:hypothetical protein